MQNGRDNSTKGWNLCGESPQKEGNVESYQGQTYVCCDMVVNLASQFPERRDTHSSCPCTIINLNILACYDCEDEHGQAGQRQSQANVCNYANSY